jgi:hypothetical protein
VLGEFTASRLILVAARFFLWLAETLLEFRSSPTDRGERTRRLRVFQVRASRAYCVECFYRMHGRGADDLGSRLRRFRAFHTVRRRPGWRFDDEGSCGCRRRHEVWPSHEEVSEHGPERPWCDFGGPMSSMTHSTVRRTASSQGVARSSQRRQGTHVAGSLGGSRAGGTID